jgi:hypothetical protein
MRTHAIEEKCQRCWRPNGILKEVAQSLRFKIKGSARNVGKAR